jgi:hypothetical protein
MDQSGGSEYKLVEIKTIENNQYCELRFTLECLTIPNIQIKPFLVGTHDNGCVGADDPGPRLDMTEQFL